MFFRFCTTTAGFEVNDDRSEDMELGSQALIALQSPPVSSSPQRLLLHPNPSNPNCRLICPIQSCSFYIPLQHLEGTSIVLPNHELARCRKRKIFENSPHFKKVKTEGSFEAYTRIISKLDQPEFFELTHKDMHLGSHQPYWVKHYAFLTLGRACGKKHSLDSYTLFYLKKTERFTIHRTVYDQEVQKIRAIVKRNRVSTQKQCLPGDFYIRMLVDKWLEQIEMLNLFTDDYTEIVKMPNVEFFRKFYSPGCHFVTGQ